MCTTQSYLDLLPEDVLDKIYQGAHKLLFKAVIDHLLYIDCRCSTPLFVTLNYEGFRPFNPAQYSGAREISVYMHDCWEPYLPCEWCGCTGYMHDRRCPNSSPRHDSEPSDSSEESLSYDRFILGGGCDGVQMFVYESDESEYNDW